MSALGDAIGHAVVAEAGVAEKTSLATEDHIALIAASARAEDEVRSILRRTVLSARAAGASWSMIGTELGMSRQAAQQRFGHPSETVRQDGNERWLGPVSVFDEMAELELAGLEGWHTVEAGASAHRMLRSDTRWEHRRSVWRPIRAAERSEGWKISCTAFPWVYLVRDTGVPVSSPPEPTAD
ncbi:MULTISPECIES: hypothetical protein [unclassified Microbacterium]|uniref:hypothetical protein n=1 Tax=unclassified Microbacterium TaxID=2609290 RepID=UPI000CFB4879|nr:MULTISPECIES: hypothetical protein [unclassified Microbacterium]PQZ59236.1 hypothetical protein CQ032_06090 [Microbacterium sp. MYb43]PQZ81329.1 hypothetical protein CQ031_05700 [Microbacterium sp. MYb40]PRB21908.1 hypothetical protein CQ040_07500 [Microbacterium sp. MYb54]PRB31677.1 hypothetical protein CQ037_02320 [Microbacterium sp. MYb50]PRB68509.1 hypothetical protein CQ021_06505 [Microbacterium sp. MYb24]